MKLLLIAGSAALLLSSAAQSAVVQLPRRIEVDAVLDGGIIAPLVTGDTLDYLTFEVLTTADVTVTSGFGGGLLLLLAQFIGRDDEFGYLGHPFRLEQTSPITFDSLSRELDPGIYVTAMGLRDHTSYDVFDGYTAVNPEGGGFTFGPYAYSIDGPVRALEFREGNLDGTFTITQIPEPTASLLLLAGGALLLSWRKRN